jgi:phenylpropionate dioxygenase-like ring-hydroxylating dioxygenase large terminal subunit
MGELLRRFWLPALTRSELADNDGAPVRLRLLGEDLVAFRDSSGAVGIIDAYCAHRGVGLFFGRNEECGLRCVYHGWKYDVNGRCLDTPNEAESSRLKDRIRLKSYPTQERAGVIWVYMGPADRQPAKLPQLEWVNAPHGHQYVEKWLQCSNWCQGMEGEIDTSHVSFLHSWTKPYHPIYENNASFDGVVSDPSPKLFIEHTPYGLTYGGRRVSGDEYYWRVTRWLYPFYSLIPGVPGCSGRCWVPIDDEHTWTFHYQSRPDRRYTEDEIASVRDGAVFPPRLTRGTFALKNGYIIDTWLPVANRENDYLLDRGMQRDVNYTGIWGVNDQDRSMQESMGAIVDRTKENLGASDSAVIVARRLLMGMARDLQKGIEPPIVQDADAYRVRAIDVTAPIKDFSKLLEAYDPTLGVSNY